MNQFENEIVDNDELLKYLKEIFSLEEDETLDRIEKKDIKGIVKKKKKELKKYDETITDWVEYIKLLRSEIKKKKKKKDKKGDDKSEIIKNPLAIKEEKEEDIGPTYAPGSPPPIEESSGEEEIEEIEEIEELEMKILILIN